METTIICSRGSAKLRSSRFKPYVLCNKRQKWDTLHWSLKDAKEVYFHGLYRGRYGECLTTVDNLVKALREVGAEAEAQQLLDAVTPA